MYGRVDGTGNGMQAQIADKISHGGLLFWNKKCELPGFFSIAGAYSF